MRIGVAVIILVAAIANLLRFTTVQDAPTDAATTVTEIVLILGDVALILIAFRPRRRPK